MYSRYRITVLEHISVYFLWCCKPFVTVREIWVVKVIVAVVEGVNIISLYAIYDPATGPEQPIYEVICVQNNFQNALSSNFELLRIKNNILHFI